VGGGISQLKITNYELRIAKSVFSFISRRNKEEALPETFPGTAHHAIIQDCPTPVLK
jgi:hypothetical protein